MQEIISAQKLSEDAKIEFIEQDRTIESASEAISNIHTALGEFVTQQMQVYNNIEELFTYKNKLVDSISEIATLTEQFAATCQMVASISMEQSNKDELIADMITTIEKIASDMNNRLSDIKISKVVSAKKRVAFISLEQQQFYDEIERAAVNTGKKLDIEVLCKSPQRYNIDDQEEIFREFMEQSVDGIILVPSDTKRFKNLIDEAIGKGIKVVCVDVDVPGSKRNVFITSDSYEGGRLAGEAAVRHLKGKGNIIALLCASEVVTVQKRYQGFVDIIKKYPDIKIINKYEQKNTDITETKKILENMIMKNPHFDLLYLVTSESAEVAIDIWKARHIDKKLVILSKGAKITEGIKDGIVSSQIVQRNILWGEMAVTLLNKLFKGYDVPEQVNTGMYEINKLNIGIFERSADMNMLSL